MPINPQTTAQSPKNWRLFKSWISFYPQSYGVNTPKLTVYRELGRLAVALYDKLSLNPLIKLPNPQGGAIDSNGSLVSGLQGALSYTPAIGQTPAYVYVSGHYYSNRDIKNPFSTRPVFSGGVLYDIPNGTTSYRAPKLEVLQDVKDLKGAIDTAVTAMLPTDTDYQLDKIDYIGVIFGLSGIHFPR